MLVYLAAMICSIGILLNLISTFDTVEVAVKDLCFILKVRNKRCESYLVSKHYCLQLDNLSNR